MRINYFLNSLIKKEDFSPTQRHLTILDGHKFHDTLEVLQKARIYGLNMTSLPSHTSHVLQPLDMVCFGSFKKLFKAYKDLWLMQGNGKKVDKQILAEWASTGFKKTLIVSNNRARFRHCGIRPLNLVAMKAKMDPNKAFTTPFSNQAQENVIIQEI